MKGAGFLPSFIFRTWRIQPTCVSCQSDESRHKPNDSVWIHRQMIKCSLPPGNQPFLLAVYLKPSKSFGATEKMMCEMVLLGCMRERDSMGGRIYYQWGVLPGGMIRRDTRAGWVLWKVLE